MVRPVAHAWHRLSQLSKLQWQADNARLAREREKARPADKGAYTAQIQDNNDLIRQRRENVQQARIQAAQGGCTNMPA